MVLEHQKEYSIQDKTIEVEENVNTWCNNNHEMPIVSPVSTTKGSTQKILTVVEYSSTPTETPYAVAPSVMSNFSLGLIKL